MLGGSRAAHEILMNINRLNACTGGLSEWMAGGSERVNLPRGWYLLSPAPEARAEPRKEPQRNCLLFKDESLCQLLPFPWPLGREMFRHGDEETGYLPSAMKMWWAVRGGRELR